ncbi:MAG: mechanosensitive ion channel [Limnochordia bacterium]|jgi:hypothetical protein
MNEYGDLVFSLWETLASRLPSIVLAIIVLFVGWILARAIASVVGRLVHRLTGGVQGRGLVETGEKEQIDRVVVRITYYLLMLFVLVQVFEILGVTAVREPFLAVTNQLALAVPNLVKAILILLAAWVIATILRSIVVRLLRLEKVGSFLDRTQAVAPEQKAEWIASAGNLVYYLVLVVFLPALLGALQLEGLKEPFEQVTTQALSFLPGLAAAIATVLVGYVIAKIIRGIVTSFLASSGVDTLPERCGLGEVFAATPLSRSLGTIAFVLVLIPVAISALESLGLQAISGPAISMLTMVLNMIPSIAVAILLLAVGVAFARWVGQLTATLLERTNVTRFLARWGLLRDEKAGGADIPQIVGGVVSGITLLLILVEVFSIIRLEQLSVILGSILAYIPNAVVAVVILVAGYGVGQFAARSLAGILENTNYPVWMASVAKYAILVLAATMSLEQLGIAETIVVTAFSILLGSLGLAAAIAIGLGSKDVVKEWADAKTKSRSD